MSNQESEITEELQKEAVDFLAAQDDNTKRDLSEYFKSVLQFNELAHEYKRK